MMQFRFSSQDWSDQEWARAGHGLELLPKRAEAGFLKAALDDSAWEKVEARAVEIRRIADNFAVVGIGGSSLGAKALIAASGAPRGLLHFESLDPEACHQALSQVKNLARTHWLWISKSGVTLELLAHLQLVNALYEREGLKLADHSTVIAEPKQGPLQSWALTHKVPMLPIPFDVSGRFSVFTAAGLLPAALAGVSLSELKAGVRQAHQSASREKARQVIAATLASWRREEWITMFWNYGDRLGPFNAWLQQLWAESLAKLKTRDGQPATRVSFPVCCVGSLDQHSILQQVMEGARDKWVWLIRHETLAMDVDAHLSSPFLPEMKLLENKTLGQIFAAQAEGTERALNQVGVHTCNWVWPKADASHAGFALFFWQVVVAALGETLGLNAFNQPGVESGKTITQSLLRKSLS